MARILIGNIKGPQGEQGPQGVQGPVGPQGPQGPLPPLVNNALATEAGVSALDAAMGKTLQDQIAELKSDLISKSEILADYKNPGVVGTVSNCWVNTIGHIAIADFGLFLVSQHLGESDVVVFTIPDGFRPRQVSYGVMSSTDGEFSTKVSAEISGEIKLSRTPSTAKYLGGQVIFLIN